MGVTRIGEFDLSGGAVAVRPTFRGTRPRDAASDVEGETVFRVVKGGQRFAGWRAEDVGNVFFVDAPVAQLAVEDIDAENVYRLLEVTDRASLRDAVIRRVRVSGIERSFIRLRNACANILLEDVHADSCGYVGDPFGIGVHVERGENITLRRVTMLNFVAKAVPGVYRNGDCFATEGAARLIHFDDTLAVGATDGGYDCKHTGGSVRRAVAQDCKIGWREWASRPDGELADLTAINCGTAMSFHKRGQVVHVGRLVVRSDKPMSAILKLEAGAATVVIHSHDIQVPAGTPLLRTEAGGNAITWLQGEPKL